MKQFPLFARAFSTLLLSAVSVQAAVFTGWTEDYTGMEASTLLLWKFDEPQPLSDSAMNYQRAATLPSGTNVTAGSGVTGKWGEGALISSSGQTLATSRILGNTSSTAAADARLALGTTATTVELWFRPQETSLNGSYLADKRYSSSSGAALRFASSGSNRLVAEVGNGTSTLQVVSGNLVWDTEEWYHIALTYTADSGTLNLFLNGELIGSQVNAGFGNLSIGTGNNWALGNRLASVFNAAPGYYDNFRVSDIAYEFASVPEPSTMALGAMALALVSLRLRRRGKCGRVATQGGGAAPVSTR